MSSLKFELVVFGGLADERESRVAADRLGEVLKGLTRDVREICRNLAEEEGKLLVLEEGEARIFVDGMPVKGKSISVPLSTDTGWGERGLHAYLSGLDELRKAPALSPAELPRGFDVPILRRVSDYCEQIAKEHSGFRVVTPPQNGTAEACATFDARLKAAVELRVAMVEHAKAMAFKLKPDHHIYNYSLQGVLYQLSDPEYDNEEGTLTVEIDPRDGTRWVCRIDKSLVPDDFERLWRTEVLVVGVALPKPRKPELQVESFLPLRGVSDPVRAMENLIALCGDLEGESTQDFLDFVRERN